MLSLFLSYVIYLLSFFFILLFFSLVLVSTYVLCCCVPVTDPASLLFLFLFFIFSVLMAHSYPVRSAADFLFFRVQLSRTFSSFIHLFFVVL